MEHEAKLKRNLASLLALLPVPTALIFGIGDESGLTSFVGFIFAIPAMILFAVIGMFIKDLKKALLFYGVANALFVLWVAFLVVAG